MTQIGQVAAQKPQKFAQQTWAVSCWLTWPCCQSPRPLLNHISSKFPAANHVPLPPNKAKAQNRSRKEFNYKRSCAGHKNKQMWHSLVNYYQEPKILTSSRFCIPLWQSFFIIFHSATNLLWHPDILANIFRHFQYCHHSDI